MNELLKRYKLQKLSGDEIALYLKTECMRMAAWLKRQSACLANVQTPEFKPQYRQTD
jgi:hypothetical protein